MSQEKRDVVADLLDLEDDVREAIPRQDNFRKTTLRSVLQAIRHLKQRERIADRRRRER